MSKYTTGELAKLCGVTVRTVQYYDARNILVPSQLSEGGRRLYSEDDRKRLEVICFLRELDLPINAIGELLAEEDPGSVISLLLEQQEAALRQEIAQHQGKLEKLTALRRGIQGLEQFSVESIADIAHIMESKKKLWKIRKTMLFTAIPMELLELGFVILWIVEGIWWPFAVFAPLMILYAIWLSRYYFRSVSYICPKCHQVFRPRFWEAFWANHTPNTRKLTCPGCGHKGFCVETCE